MKAKLKNVSKVITKGTTPTTVGGELVESGINFIKSESITKSKYLDSSLYTFIDEKTDEKLKRSRLEQDDLLCSIAGAYLGKLSIVRKCDIPANTNQAVGIVRLDPTKVDVDYVYYYFSQKNVNEYINNLSSQSSQPNLNLSLLGNLEFDCRLLTIQQKIAKVLSTLDAKIELNNKINQELEQMAKLLYDYWFVQFDFPDVEGKPYKSSGGKMVYNEVLKREIPEGWKDAEIATFGKVITGKTPSSKNPKYFGQEIPFITPTDFNKNGKWFISSERFLSSEGKDVHSSNILPSGAILVTCIGSDMGKVGINAQESMTNQQINSIIPNDKYTQEYLYQYLKQIYKYLKMLANAGSTMPIINKTTFEKLSLPKPTSHILIEFSRTIEPMNKKIVNNTKETQALTELRDWLLPMLMNGQVVVE